MAKKSEKRQACKSAKKKVTETVAYEINVDYSSYCTHSYRSPEDYGDWQEDNEVYVGSEFTVRESLIKDSRYSDMLVGFKPEKGRPYYVVYGIYSTGDSFGQESGRLHFVDLFETKEEAQTLEKLIRDNYANNEYQFSIEFGKKSYSLPWVGYFESLTHLEVKEVFLVDKFSDTASRMSSR